MHDLIIVRGNRRDWSWEGSTRDFIPTIRSATPTAFITTRPTSTFTSQFARAPKTGAMSAVARRDPANPSTKSRWTASNRGSSLRTRGGKILSSPQKLEETLSKRLDGDKLVFSPKLNHLQMNALQSAPKFRLILVAADLPVNSQCGSIVGRETASARSAAQLPVCFATPETWRIGGDVTCRQIWHGVERRSLHQLQSLLFNLKRQSRTLHKRYSQIYGFSVLRPSECSIPVHLA